MCFFGGEGFGFFFFVTNSVVFFSVQSELSSISCTTGRMESDLKLLEGQLGKEKETTGRLRSELALVTDKHMQVSSR